MAILWGPVLFWMAAIFYVSSVNTWTVDTAPAHNVLLRKGAHAFEYAVLGLLIGRAVLGSLTSPSTGRPPRLLARAWWIATLVAVLYAVSDELHQSFVPKREFHVTDILIDSVAAAGALGIWYFWKARAAGNQPRDMEKT